MSKDFIEVKAHRRPFPKRKFADGGASASGSDRPDLDILARQGLSPEKAPGMPPRIGYEHDMFDRSDVQAGSAKATPMTRFEQDPIRTDENKGSVLKEMLDTSADRVQQHHDYSRQGAAIRAAHDPSAKRFADGGAYRTPEQIAADRERAYGFNPMGSYSLGTDAAEEAAPSPIPSRVPSTMPAPLTSSRGSASRQMSADAPPVTAAPSTPTPMPETESGVPPPARAASGSSQNNSPGAPKPITFKDIAQGAVNSSGGGGSPIGTLASLAGGALGTYMKKRGEANAEKATATKGSDVGGAPHTGVSSNFPADGGGGGGPHVYDEPNLSRPAGPQNRGGDDDTYDEGTVGGVTHGGPEGDSGGYNNEEPIDLSSFEEDRFAEGGKVSPRGGMNQRQARPMRPGAPGSGMGSLGAAPPGGGSSFGAAPGGPPPGGPPQSSWTPSQMQPVGNPNSPWAAANLPGNPNNPPGMGGPPPGGPPPGMPPGMPPGGPGPSFGGMPPGGPPPGGGMMGPMQGPPPGGPPPGPPPGQSMMGAMQGPPPGGPPPGMPPGGPPPQAAMGPMAPPPGGPPPGPPPMDPRMAAALAQRAQLGGAPGMKKGGAVEDTEGFSPRAKGTRERVWGDVGKPAEDLPPVVEKKAKGGVLRRRPGGKKHAPKKTPPVPMVTDEDMDPPPPTALSAGPSPMGPPPAGPPPGPPPAAPPPGMKKGGAACEGMAAGGVAKLRRGFPKTNSKPKRMAKGGSVRGCGVATKGKKFSGVY